MTVSAQDSAIHGALFSDAEVAALFSDVEAVRAMVRVEAALARVQGRLGVIPAAAADAIDQALAGFEPDLAAIGAGTAASGVPVIALVEQLRRAVGGEAAAFLHWGATSQDVIDTGLILRLGRVLELLETRLERLIERLAGLADRHRATLMAARTRSQQALPTTFGLKAAGWLLPLPSHCRRLGELRPRLLVVQFGGAAGTLAALGKEGLGVMTALAEELGLHAPPAPWHARRDNLAEIAGWLSLVTGSLGKMGQDLALLAQSEVGEVTAGAGGSSTMPQKANPVAAETLVALARMNAGLLGSLHHAMVQEHERGGAGWSLEWLSLPQMAAATGAALGHAPAILDTLTVDAERMRRNLEASEGLVLAEAASFALAAHMARPEAEALVKAACKRAAGERRHLMDVLRESTDAPVDWDRVADPATYLGMADALIDRVLAEARR